MTQLSAPYREEMQKITSVFYETFKEFGLELATKKTEIMMQKAYENEQRPEPKILFDDETKTPDLKSVETMIRLSRLRYTGHVMRMDNSRLPKIILYGEINMGKRKVGRTKQNFRSCIKEDLNAP